MEQCNNSVILRGELVGLPEFSHENHGRKFFRFFLDVARLSGTLDRLPVIAEESVLAGLDPSAGDMIRVTGQVRSHNSRLEGVRRLLIFVFAQNAEVEDGDPVNEILLEGSVCRDPSFRRTPLGREICDVMLAVPRAFHRADYLPCILWGHTAQQVSQCGIRDRIQLSGRLQSRLYTKQTPEGPQERTAYEISALHAEVLDQAY